MLLQITTAVKDASTKAITHATTFSITTDYHPGPSVCAIILTLAYVRRAQRRWDNPSGSSLCMD